MWLFARVDSTVGIKVSFLAEAFPAAQALVRPLPSVDSLMGVKVRAARKSFPTGCAFVGPLTFASFAVPNQLQFLTKSFPAVRALKRLFSHVNAFVFDEHRALTESFSISIADSLSLTGVDSSLERIFPEILERSSKRKRRVGFLDGAAFLLSPGCVFQLAELGDVLPSSPH